MLRNLRIAPRAALFFGLLGLTTLLLGIFAITQQNRLVEITDELGNMRLQQVALVGEMRRDFLTMRLYTANFALSGSRVGKDAALKTVEESGRSFQANGDKLGALVSEQGRKLLQDALAHVDEYRTSLAQWMQAINSGNTALAEQIDVTLTRQGAVAVESVNKLVTFELEQAANSVAHAKVIESSSFTSIVVAIVISIVA